MINHCHSKFISESPTFKVIKILGFRVKFCFEQLTRHSELDSESSYPYYDTDGVGMGMRDSSVE